MHQVRGGLLHRGARFHFWLVSKNKVLNICIDGYKLSSEMIEELAIADGFDGTSSFVEFFVNSPKAKRLGEQLISFSGQLIKWGELCLPEKMPTKPKVFTRLPPSTILECYSTIYEDRHPSFPWQTEDPELLALCAWPKFSPNKGAVVLGTVKHYFGFPVRVLQWWRIPQTNKGEN